MPTGYTHGIIDGDVKTFKEFATLCMRNFGALIHMREDKMDTPYRERTPGDYHTKAIEKAKQELQFAETAIDEEIIKNEKVRLKEHIERMSKQIEESKVIKKKLSDMLNDAYSYKAPTVKHEEIRRFMIKQLTITIDFDGKSIYSREEIKEAKFELENIHVKVVSEELIKAATKELEYHTEEHRKDVERCEESNEWVKTFLKSLESANN